MHHTSTLGIFLSSLLIGNTFAGTMGPVTHDSSWAGLVSLSGGPSWTNPGQNQSFFLQQDLQKAYIKNDKSQTLASAELFLGLQKLINPSLKWQIGAAIAGSSNARLAGDIWEDADPNFNNYFYTYKINHRHLALKSNLVFEMSPWAQPYISASIGAAKNRAHDFMITPKIEEEVPAPNFSSHSTTAFTYTVGLGVQKNMTEHVAFGIGYEFSDWGKSNLGSAPQQTLNKGLILNHLYTNQLKFTLSYVA